MKTAILSELWTVQRDKGDQRENRLKELTKWDNQYASIGVC